MISVFIIISLSSFVFVCIFVFIDLLGFRNKVEEEVEEGSCRIGGKLIGIDADVSIFVNNSLGEMSVVDGKLENEREDEEEGWRIFFLDLLRYGLGSREGRGISIFIANSGSGPNRAPGEISVRNKIKVWNEIKIRNKMEFCLDYSSNSLQLLLRNKQIKIKSTIELRF